MSIARSASWGVWIDQVRHRWFSRFRAIKQCPFGDAANRRSAAKRPMLQSSTQRRHHGGSWKNVRLLRRPPSGYKVVIVRFADGHPVGEPEDILTGFLSTDGNALGRPVGVGIDRPGAMLVADDVGNRVWRVRADQTWQAEPLPCRIPRPRNNDTPRDRRPRLRPEREATARRPGLCAMRSAMPPVTLSLCRASSCGTSLCAMRSALDPVGAAAGVFRAAGYRHPSSTTPIIRQENGLSCMHADSLAHLIHGFCLAGQCSV